MIESTPALHVYDRTVTVDGVDSLSLLARHVFPGQKVLDLGMGSGALGRFLRSRVPLEIDGVTLSEEEAVRAADSYRRTWVADLDAVDLPALVADRYDCIVCADVLEHLKDPARLLAQCRQLLKPGGCLLTSVPNVGHYGLLAELLQGDWRYREEGLLDQTHLRFFTRRSLLRFFAAERWQTTHLQTTTRDLQDSEFRVALDTLPPAVARFLLALPDATTYQFVQRLEPVEQVQAPDLGLVPMGAPAVFSAQLYLAVGGAFDESRKVVTRGVMGEPQTLAFGVPPAGQGTYSALRLDLADRPGFLRLQDLQVLDAQGAVLWQWRGAEDALDVLRASPSSEIVWSTPWGRADEAWLTLFGDDPWLVLPVPPQALAELSSQGGQVCMRATWPMSADYVQALQNVRELKREHDAQQQHLTARIQSLEMTLSRVRQEAEQALSGERQEAEQALMAARTELAAWEARHQHWQEVERLHALAMQESALRLNSLESQKTALGGRLAHVQGLADQLRVQLQEAQAYVERIESSRLFRWTRPLARLNYRLRHDAAKASAEPPLLPLPAGPERHVPRMPVDVIVPVYRGLEDTRRCIESVLGAPGQAAWHLVVINDCSPEPEVTAWLRALARVEPRVELLENEQNLGFVATVNRGMRLHPERDVVLLNSDAEVANDWLDRLKAAAHADARVGTVTPFSNHATICSYPRFCQANDLPQGWSTADLDSLCARYLKGRAVDVPTAVGFCMYIRRDCLNEVGGFDEEHFGKGYGEENDFCIRASAAGWRHLHALDIFVRHAGGVSFGDAKTERELRAVETLDRLHPGYSAAVHAFVAQDPARNARLLLDLARLTSGHKALVLMVTHNREGGTQRHVRELVQAMADKAVSLVLRPEPGGVSMSMSGAQEVLRLDYKGPGWMDLLVRHLRLLRVTHVHFHHLLGHEDAVMELPMLLGVSHDFTAHDFYSYCPQISLTDRQDRYCGERGLDQCTRCLMQTPAPDGSTIEGWRARYAPLLSSARYVLAPSEDTARRLRAFVPAARVVAVPHANLLPDTASADLSPVVRKRAEGQPLKVAVIGALSRIKGADMLEQVAMLAAEHRVPVEFHLLGYGYRHLRKPPAASLVVHGPYEEADLPGLLEWLGPDVVWFPAQWPETYSYTLSACLAARLPVVVPDLGALAERVAGRDWSWVMPWTLSASEWLAFFERIGQAHFSSGQPPVPVPAAQPYSARTFDYRRDYLQDLSTREAPEADALVTLLKELVGLQSALQPMSAGQQASSRVVEMLYRLRRMPLLSVVARAIPTATQRRIKSWLLS